MNTGDRCWYWDRDIEEWVSGVIVGTGTKNKFPVYDVRLDDGSDRWGYEEQFKHTQPGNH